MEEGKTVILKIKYRAKGFKCVDNKGRREKYSVIRCKVLKEYNHHYLVQHKNYKECLLKADFITKDIEILRGKIK